MVESPNGPRTPDSTRPPPHADTRFSEWDLNLVNALQINPRAPWSRIGPALGVDAATAARHWQRLTAAGLAWTTAYAPEYAVVGWVQLRCGPDSLGRVAELVCRCPSIYSVESTGGSFQFDLTVAVADLAAFDDFVVRWLGALPGVAAIRAVVGLDMYVEGADWRPEALDRDERARLTDDDEHARLVRSVRRETDRLLVAALGEDARLPLAELATAVGSSQTTVRRRLGELLASGRLILRCDMSRQIAGWPIAVTYRAELPAEQLRSLGLTVADWGEIRLCTATFGGDTNLIIIAWLRMAHDAIDLEARLSRAFPELRIIDRQVSLRTVKRMGRVLDDQGRALEFIPIRIWS
ncbi:Lrp/AsnC family transcriptional regulator [Nocardia sp. NBC_01503]|uniref:Lrp/AsnC family transcriptional regulator n=1 Tax=Nocardia sp. NBC_01503 TaxID=2975997 RepID=UPI002E7B8F53|nr:Lrp/AsnC family transcriptional regulator [Nocardia sp. NBC_01503]WTL30593.1 Lrp/AsnC family transcriptional regulator [Nocardia sp. NBC_01503]